MGERQFTLVARIRTTDHAALGAALANLIPQGIITPTSEGFRVEAELEGTSARDLNRMLLSGLRRVDRRATLHAAWTSEGITEHFFDYTARGMRPAYPIQVFAVIEEHSDFEHVGFHWHLLVKGVDFLPNQVVSDALRSATQGRSYITKVQRVRNQTAVGYVTKYLTKEIMRADRGIQEEQREVALVALDAVTSSQEEWGEVFEYRVRQDGQERVVEVKQVQVVERLCKAHRIRYSRSFFPERTAELRRRLFGQQDEEEIGVDAEPGETVVVEMAPNMRREDGKGEVSLVEQAPIEVPGVQESAICGGVQEQRTSPVNGEVWPVRRSVWVLYESAPFSDDIGEYKQRRRRALVESLADLRGGKRMSTT